MADVLEGKSTTGVTRDRNKKKGTNRATPPSPPPEFCHKLSFWGCQLVCFPGTVCLWENAESSYGEDSLKRLMEESSPYSIRHTQVCTYVYSHTHTKNPFFPVLYPISSPRLTDQFLVTVPKYSGGYLALLFQPIPAASEFQSIESCGGVCDYQLYLWPKPPERVISSILCIWEVAQTLIRRRGFQYDLGNAKLRQQLY